MLELRQYSQAGGRQLLQSDELTNRSIIVAVVRGVSFPQAAA